MLTIDRPYVPNAEQVNTTIYINHHAMQLQLIMSATGHGITIPASFDKHYFTRTNTPT